MPMKSPVNPTVEALASAITADVELEVTVRQW